MKSNRRNFLKTAAFAGAGAVAGSMMQGCAPKEPESNMAEVLAAVKKTHSQKFNKIGRASCRERV